MSRLIDAEAITDHEIIDYLGIRYASCLDDVRDMLNDQPTIEAAPVRRGEWVKEENTWVCSVCRKENGCAYSEELERFLDFFCPKCGADMRKGGANQ